MTESDFTLLILAVLAGGLAFLPATLTWKNLRLFQRSPDTHTSDHVSILVPVRNEAAVLNGFIVRNDCHTSPPASSQRPRCVLLSVYVSVQQKFVMARFEP